MFKYPQKYDTQLSFEIDLFSLVIAGGFVKDLFGNTTKSLIKRYLRKGLDSEIDSYLISYKFDSYNRITEVSIKNEQDS